MPFVVSCVRRVPIKPDPKEITIMQQRLVRFVRNYRQSKSTRRGNSDK